MALLIRNAHIINADNSFHADILTKEGQIKKIGVGLQPGENKPVKVLDATGKLIFPGGIDPHVHMHLPTGSGHSSDDFRTGSNAALMGGTTTIIDFVTPKRGQSLIAAVDNREKEAADCHSNLSFHVSPVEWRSSTADEIRACFQRGYNSFKIYMAYKEHIGIDDDVVRKVMQTVAEEGGLVLAHCEMGKEIEHLRNKLAQEGKLSPASHPRSRPPKTESDAVAKAIQIAKDTGCPLYIVHVSTAESVALIREARMSGQNVMGEACPHHLLLDESLYEQDFHLSAPYVLSPPLRSKKHRTALWEGLADGTLQTVGTDHCPFMMNQKEKGKNDFRKIANGAGGVEHRLALLYTFGVLRNKISLNDFVRLTSTNPAKIFGLYPRKGLIEEGADADLVIWDPDKEQTISASSHHQNCDHNIYEGFKTVGAPQQIFLKGKRVTDY